MSKKVLVLGGAGYIGSHMVRVLQEEGYQAIVFDNLSTGHRKAVAEGALLIEGSLTSREDVDALFRKISCHGVMHFAASSIVPESVRDPLKYYRNNVLAFINLLEAMMKYRVPHLIFSSTAAVYGEPSETPLREQSRTEPANPYGRSKLMIEQMLAHVSAAVPEMKWVALRYFNAAGAHESGEIGERHDPETHLIPNVLRAAAGKAPEVNIFGDDYPTPDGTCVRDYIHVMDLCEAHLKALAYLSEGGESRAFNLGTGRGCSVKEIIETAEKVTQRKIPVKISPRRPGDPSELVASAERAREVLGWTPKKSLFDIIQSAWRWHQNEWGAS